jgi:hypothetical protein
MITKFLSRTSTKLEKIIATLEHTNNIPIFKPNTTSKVY